MIGPDDPVVPHQAEPRAFLRPIRDLSPESARGIRCLLTDIDDTMTREGRLLDASYRALWRLHEAGIRVVPVTGRPAGWCDLIARQWPVDGVVGENGAVAFYMEGRTLKHIHHPDVATGSVQDALRKLEREILSRVPGSRVAKDQFSRLYDLAVDFREEPPYLDLEDAERIRRICVEQGANAKISSIHVNAWFGTYDKLAMARIFLDRILGIDIDTEPEAVIYCGDSPNDEPMFRFFPLGCGVANIRPFLPMMRHHPAFLTERQDGEGFAEAVDILLERRT